MLARREHSYQELRLKLCQRGFCDSEVIAELDSLKEQGLLSESRYAEMILNSRINKGYGPNAIEQILKSNGVSQTVISEVFYNSNTNWSELVISVWRKKFRDILPKNQAERAKQVRFLLHRGFSSEQVQTALEACYNQCSSN